MKLIEELIDNLSSSKPDLTTALMKTKVLLHKLGRDDLSATWVNREINGYPPDVPVPDYRRVIGKIEGDISNGYYIVTNSLPI